MHKLNRNLFSKAFFHIKNRLKYFNISNKNILDTLAKESYYNKYKKVYKKYLKRTNYSFSNNCNNKRVWIFWYQGLDNAPDLVNSTISSIKKCLCDKEIVILTKDNLNQYVILPDYIEKKFQNGNISFAHYSDLIRLELLTSYGGLWIDSTILLTGRPFFVDMDMPLFVYKDITLFRKQGLPVVASNWLIYSNGKSNILFLTKELLFQFWKRNNYVTVYSIFHIFFKLATEVYEDEWNSVPTFSNIPPHVLQFELLNDFDKSRFMQIMSMSDVHKLNHRLSSDNKNSYYHYIVNEFNDFH